MAEQPSAVQSDAATHTENYKEKKLRITLVKSPIGSQARARRTLDALGIRKINHSVTQPDNASIRGMLYLVSHLVTIAEFEE